MHFFAHLFTFLCLTGTVLAQDESFELQKLVPAASGAIDLVGSSVAIDGDFVLIGAPGDDTDGTDAGAVYVFSGNSELTFHAKLTAGASGNAFDGFGGTVAISGNRIVVGAPGDDDNTLGIDAGSVYVFECDGPLSWAMGPKITAPDGATGDRFGNVAISGSWMVVGAPGADESALVPDSGSAYVFERTGVNTWVHHTTLTPLLSAGELEANDQFGVVAIDDTTIAVGAWRKDGAPCGDPDPECNSGAVYVFERSLTVWSLDETITADMGELENDDIDLRFGKAIDIDKPWMVIGACGDDQLAAEPPASSDPANNTGAAYTFEDVAGTWTMRTKLQAFDREPLDFFGNSVAISGRFALIGAPNEDSGGRDSGAAYVFVRTGTIWAAGSKLVALDADSTDLFGAAVALDAEKGIAGAPFDDETGLLAGSAYALHVAETRFRAYCFGDGPTTLCGADCGTCPCGNEVPGTKGGCENSTGGSAILIPSGIPSAANDTLRFEMIGGPMVTGQSGLLISGDQSPAPPPGQGSSVCPAGSGINSILQPLDGVRCVRNFVRNGSRSIDSLDGSIGLTNNGWGDPDNPSAGLIANGGYSAGQTKHFQVIYRDPNHGACVTDNTSNAVSVVFEL